MKLNFSIFVKELLLFAGALYLGLYLTANRILLSMSGIAPEPVEFSLLNIVVIISVFIVVSFVLVRYARAAYFLFSLFFFMVIFIGAQLFGALALAFPWDVVFALVVVTIALTWRSVLTHNIVVMLGIAGVSAVLGMSMTPIVALLILVVFSVYDIIAVYKTKHMVRLARSMIESGVIFGFIVPAKWRGFLTHRDNAKLGERFMILGSGDIGLPIIFSASLMQVSRASAIIVAGFSILGLFITHLLFTNQKRRVPMAAFPPIATLCIVGYLIAILIGY